MIKKTNYAIWLIYRGSGVENTAKASPFSTKVAVLQQRRSKRDFSDTGGKMGYCVATIGGNGFNWGGKGYIQTTAGKKL